MISAGDAAEVIAASGKDACILIREPAETGELIQLQGSDFVLLGEVISCRLEPDGYHVRLGIEHFITNSAVSGYWFAAGSAGGVDHGSETATIASAQARIAERERWLAALYRIPSIFGRLSRLVDHRRMPGDRYVEPTLAATLGSETTHAFLRDLHFQVFSDWLSLTLEEKLLDLRQYFSEQPGHRREAVRRWLEGSPDTGIIPAAAPAVDRELYAIELNALSALIAADDATPGTATTRQAALAPDRV